MAHLQLSLSNHRPSISQASLPAGGIFRSHRRDARTRSHRHRRSRVLRQIAGPSSLNLSPVPRGTFTCSATPQQDPEGDLEIAQEAADKIDDVVANIEKNAEDRVQANSVIEDIKRKLGFVQGVLPGETEGAQGATYGANHEANERYHQMEEAVRQKAREVEEREPGRATGTRVKNLGNPIPDPKDSNTESPHPLGPFSSGAALVALGTALLSSTALAVVDLEHLTPLSPLPGLSAALADVSTLLPRGSPNDLLPDQVLEGARELWQLLFFRDTGREMGGLGMSPNERTSSADVGIAAPGDAVGGALDAAGADTRGVVEGVQEQARRVLEVQEGGGDPSTHDLATGEESSVQGEEAV